MPNLATGVFRDELGAVVMVVQNAVAPSNEEWEAYLAIIRSCLDLPNASGLAFTDGGTPDALQRGRVNELIRGRRAPSAVVSNSLAVRSVITALRWFSPETAAFPPRNVQAALSFARVEGRRVPAVWRAVLAPDRQLTPPAQLISEADSLLRKAI